MNPRRIGGNDTAGGRQQNRCVEIVVADERGGFGDAGAGGRQVNEMK